MSIKVENLFIVKIFEISQFFLGGILMYIVFYKDFLEIRKIKKEEFERRIKLYLYLLKKKFYDWSYKMFVLIVYNGQELLDWKVVRFYLFQRDFESFGSGSVFFREFGDLVL